ncbi:DUF4235 domain-containing protein [Actinomycetospora cinnamomea]|uniref:Uncharacterized protein DUF4235 n=1 Tax=Actinomycetospora cinnamomea TaxID=663609 RepID=A0A2U1FCQ9_9PSEU|nr:DUF4235 domain-containing protein [Actinomycetospora cinnamomea]PVZ09946.1 uncharacterized protein DUF4235 [Actinomycetospora cinnamomea]
MTQQTKQAQQAQRGRHDTGPTSTSAKVLYRPVGMVASLLGGLIANMIFTKIWQRVAPHPAPPEPPDALDSGTDLKTILLAAGLQGAIFAVVRVVIDRAGALAFERWSGEWPGN